MKKDKIKFLIIRNVKAPSRAYEYDAGIDFYVPLFSKTFLKDLLEKNLNNDLREGKDSEGVFIEVPAHSQIMIPSGVKTRMSKPGRALIAHNKSGVATKTGFTFGAQVVDYTYKGEIHLSLLNTSSNSLKIRPRQKIIQFLEIPVFNSDIKIAVSAIKDIEAASKLFYKGLKNDRKDGGFGSTDKK